MRRKREDYRITSNATVYARRALAITLVVIALLVLIVGVLIVR